MSSELRQRVYLEHVKSCFIEAVGDRATSFG